MILYSAKPWRMILSMMLVVMVVSLAMPFRVAHASDISSIKAEIKDLNDDVKTKRKELENLQKKEDRYRKLIAEKKAVSASLQDQIGLLENRVAKSQLDIAIAKQEVRALELEMGLIDGKIKNSEATISQERRLLGGLSRKLYRAEFRRSAFDVMFSHSSLSEYFDTLRAVTDLQTGVNRSLSKVKEAKDSLQAERNVREVKRLAVEEKKHGLEVARRELEDERSLKDSILLETKASELEYRYLLADLKREQDQADSEISYLEKSLREKISVADKLRGQDAVLSWPLVPARGLSTLFHDPEYPFRYVYEHPGVDIRAAQGTPVRAAAAGVVARAKNAGMGYSYIMLIHNNDVSTVYGHLSKITASEDSFVERGEIIGYSGGMPGTPGAGRMTTGPHLHFESRIRGIPADPLSYLVAY